MESEYEDDDEIVEQQKHEPVTKISWLLQIALENLGVTVSSYIVSLSSKPRHRLMYKILRFPSNINLFFFCRTQTETKAICDISSGAPSKPSNYLNDCTALQMDQTTSFINC